MNFYTYMVRNYKGDVTPECRLANVMRSDRDRFPKNSKHKLKAWGDLLLGYVMRHQSIYGEYTDTFKKCWEEYATCEKSKWSKNS